MTPSDFLIVATPFVLVGASSGILWFLLTRAYARDVARNEERRDDQRHAENQMLADVLLKLADKHIGGEVRPSETKDKLAVAKSRAVNDRPIDSRVGVGKLAGSIGNGTTNVEKDGETSSGVTETTESLFPEPADKSIIGVLQSIISLLLPLVAGQATSEMMKRARNLFEGQELEESEDGK